MEASTRYQFPRSSSTRWYANQIDYVELHYSIKDICGQSGEPVNRLTPLGWTCIGAADVIAGSTPLTHFNMAYFVHQLNSVIQKANTRGRVSLQRIWKLGAVQGRDIRSCHVVETRFWRVAKQLWNGNKSIAKHRKTALKGSAIGWSVF